jgi:hypothetical protein
MDASERDELVRDVVEALERRGVPSGVWMVDIAQGREALRRLDDLPRDLERAIVDGAPLEKGGAAL